MNCSYYQLGITPGLLCATISRRNHCPPSRGSHAPEQTSAGCIAGYFRLFCQRWDFTFTTVNTGMIGTITFVLFFTFACKHFRPNQLESSVQSREMPVLPLADLKEDTYHISLFFPPQPLTAFLSTSSVPLFHQLP